MSRLIVIAGLAIKEWPRRPGSMTAAIFFQIGVRDAEMTARRVIGIGRQFVPELQGANIWRVLETHSMFMEGLVGDREGEFARIRRGFADHKGVLADQSLRLELHELDQNFSAHFAPEASDAAEPGLLSCSFSRAAASEACPRRVRRP